MLVHPILHGAPVLTAQAFYYLEELEAVAKIRFENPSDSVSNDELEYIVDNYLFAYSKAYPESRISFKVSEGKFWNEEAPEFYLDVDQRHTDVLVLGVLNDSNVESVRAIDPSDSVDLQNWDIGRNYAQELFDAYMTAMEKLLEKKVMVLVSPSEERNGYMGKLRVIKTGYGLISRAQAEQLSYISLRSVLPSKTSLPLKPSHLSQTCEFLPVHHFYTSKLHTPILLSHYFSGLKELSPLKTFVGFYNVLEYYFEEAPRFIGRAGSSELSQLKCVIELIITARAAEDFLSNLPEAS